MILSGKTENNGGAAPTSAKQRVHAQNTIAALQQRRHAEADRAALSQRRDGISPTIDGMVSTQPAPPVSLMADPSTAGDTSLGSKVQREIDAIACAQIMSGPAFKNRMTVEEATRVMMNPTAGLQWLKNVVAKRPANWSSAAEFDVTRPRDAAEMDAQMAMSVTSHKAVTTTRDGRFALSALAGTKGAAVSTNVWANKR